MKSIYTIAMVISCATAFAQVPASFTSKGVGGGGALFCPSINPGNDSDFFVSCDMTELFHSTNFGLSYTQSNFSQLQAGSFSRVAYTASGKIYTTDISNDLYAIKKSSNKGVTWTTVSGNPDATEPIYSIYADYNNANRVVMNYYNQLYFSSNGGTTFTNIHNAVNTGAGVVVGGVFFDGNTIYIGTNDGVIVSTNGGVSFNVVSIAGIPAGESIFSFAAAKQNGITRFFCVTGSVNNIYNGLAGYDYWGFLTGVYACDYGVTNWVPKMNGINVSTDFIMYVSMAENNINKVYLAGSSSSSEPNIMRSVDGGNNWVHTFLTASNQNITTGWSGANGDRTWTYGECVLGFAVAPKNADKLIFTDLGFVHVSADSGANWWQAYVSSADENTAGSNTPKGKAYASIGIENTTCWQVYWIDSLNMFSCFSDIKGVRSTNAGNKWSFNYYGLNANSTYRIAKNISNSTLYAATSNIHDMYQSTRLQDATLDATDAEGKILYSTTNGASWQLLHLFSHPVFWFATDPSNANRAYASVIHYSNGAGIGGIYRCDDLQNLAASTWTKLPNPPRTQGHPACIQVLKDGKVVCTFSGRRTSAGAFTNSSGCFIYDPAGNTWTDVSATGMYYWTKDVVIDPSDTAQNTWFVGVFSGWGGAPNGLGGLYRTTNRGASWTKINALDRVTSVTFNPKNYDMIYMTTEQNGLWYSTNIHDAAPVFSQVNTYPFRQPERVFFNPYNPAEIWVSSFGNGMKVGNICSSLKATITAAGPTTFCKPGSVTLNANTGTGLGYQWRKGVNNINNATVSSYVASTSGSYKCVVSNVAGCTRLSNSITVTAQVCPQKETEISSSNEISIYPNPATDIINIESTINFTSIKIFDVMGKLIATVNSKNTISISELKSGVYFLEIETDGRINSRKSFVKM